MISSSQFSYVPTCKNIEEVAQFLLSGSDYATPENVLSELLSLDSYIMKDASHYELIKDELDDLVLCARAIKELNIDLLLLAKVYSQNQLENLFNQYAKKS